MSRPEKVLVTGGAGYIGSWVLRRLLAAGYEVTAYDALMFNPQSLLGVLGQPGFSFVRGDVRDRKAVDAAVKGMDHVVHLAAIVGEAACNKDPELTKTVNIEGTKVVAQAAAEHRVKRLICFSTCSS
ncbi:MAG: NAD(P)-dependent oxidoreductase, partial [Elusimicrobia bacterium]|nr:NAD(P)-dependent oxidoreductase [Elusimicrobiota bacterium]